MPRTKKKKEESITKIDNIKEEPKSKKSKSKKKATVEVVHPKEKHEKALFIQRLLAFLLDVFLVSMVASFIVSPFLDLDSIQKLNDASTQVMESYTAFEIDASEYMNESMSISYELARKQGLMSFVIIFLNILYFVVFQIKNGGQTLGKQLLKIKVVDQDNKDLTMNQMIFRSLIINSILLDMISLAMVIFARQDVYFYGAAILSFIQMLIFLISGIKVMFGKERRGVHDLVAHTDVVQCNLVREMETCES